jgi:hypothetical protein
MGIEKYLQTQQNKFEFFFCKMLLTPFILRPNP